MPKLPMYELKIQILKKLSGVLGSNPTMVLHFYLLDQGLSFDSKPADQVITNQKFTPQLPSKNIPSL